MSVKFNMSELSRFSIPGFGNENTVVNLDGDGLKSGGTLGSKLARAFLIRFSGTRTRNNAVRTELLASLGRAFGLTPESSPDNGKVRFPPKFMDELERLIGRDVLKREDFKIAADGSVTSGRPLTQRRITAILSKAALYDSPAGAEFDAAGYRRKLGIMRSEIRLEDHLQGNNVAKASAFLTIIDKGLNFLENLGKKDFIRIKYAFDAALDDADRDEAARKEVLDSYEGTRFEYYDDTVGKGEYVPYTDSPTYGTDKPGEPKGISQFLNERLNGGGDGGSIVFHLERSGWKHDRATDAKAINKYYLSIIKSLVSKTIDAYFESKRNGSVDKYCDLLASPGACMEDKNDHMIEFFDENFAYEKLSEDERYRIELIADGMQTDVMIKNKIQQLMEHAEFKDLNNCTWKNVGAALKEALVGSESIIVKLRRDGQNNPVKDDRGELVFDEVTDEKGKQVVRKLTAEDIEEIGKPYYVMLYGED